MMLFTLCLHAVCMTACARRTEAVEKHVSHRKVPQVGMHWGSTVVLAFASADGRQAESHFKNGTHFCVVTQLAMKHQ